MEEKRLDPEELEQIAGGSTTDKPGYWAIITQDTYLYRYANTSCGLQDPVKKGTTCNSHYKSGPRFTYVHIKGTQLSGYIENQYLCFDYNEYKSL